MDKLKVLAEIKGFLEGYNNDLKYLVNVETDPNTDIAECLIREPNKEQKILKFRYEPFTYVKDLAKLGRTLYEGYSDEYIKSKRIKYGITITKLKTGNQKRLVNGFCYKVTSSKSYNAIVNYFRDGGIDIFAKVEDNDGNVVRNKKGDVKFINRDLFHAPKTTEQFFISTQSRLFKGIEEYRQIHKFTFDIETTGLRYQMARIILIGVRDNKGFEMILEPEKPDDDEAEARLIQDFFNVIDHIRPSIISGYNSEMFDFEFILGRAKLLKMDLSKVPTSLKEGAQLKRKPRTSVKYGNTADKYTATEMWGYSVIDILHAVRRTAAVNSEIKENKLKYIAKFEKIAKPNRTYIAGEDNQIGRIFNENKIFVIDVNNNYIQIPNEHQIVARKLYTLQANKETLSPDKHFNLRLNYLNEAPDFVKWFRTEALPKKMNSFIGGKNLVKQYLLDDLWETEHVDELYNQSSFMLAKIVPTTYQRICTMGTAGIWNLLMTAWSYENDLAIPVSDVKLPKKFAGGLARCFKSGFSKRIIKIDFAGLYPSIQLTEDVFPIFDITGVMKKILLYLTTTRNIYKKLGNSVELNDEEIMLFKQIDPEYHLKYLNKSLTPADIAMFKIKQLPIKILNNSLYGALGSDVSFNWSDNVCAARITCTGRLHLRHAISWFSKFNCVALLAVTDGTNFQYPEKTTIRITNEGTTEGLTEGLVEEMWQYNGKTGINALIEKFNKEEMKPPYMSVDNDGESISCLNLSRINYATLSLAKDKKSGEMKEKIKLTGNTIKSKIMPGYIEDFIDKGLEMILHDKGNEFVKYYSDYAENLYLCQIPLKKIASKSKIKTTITAYKKRGKDKNGREKGKQAHMELLIEKRNKIAEELFQKHKESLVFTKAEDKLSIEDKIKLVTNYMPPEPELDSVVYYVNTGTKISEGNSGIIKDKITGEERYCATLITADDLLENPDMIGKYNVAKYLNAFNKRVTALLVGFDPEVSKKILARIIKDKKTKEVSLKCGGENFASYELGLKNFDLNDFDEAMHLEEKEVEYWNKTGYDPRKIWNGFKMYDDNKVYYEIYDHALNYLNEKMVANNKPKIKSINEEYGENDLILIKYGDEYIVGKHNGTFIETVRENVVIPKSDIEIELDRKKAEQEERIKNLEITLAAKSEKDREIELVKQNREKYFDRFKKRFNIPEDMTMDELFREENSASEMLDFYVGQMEGIEDEEELEYVDGENEDNDGAY
jgi:DNA polymerase elongation subunit (family B)